jgi:hypothetical protein
MRWNQRLFEAMRRLHGRPMIRVALVTGVCVVFTIFYHAHLHGNRQSCSAIVPGASLPKISSGAPIAAPNRQGHFAPASFATIGDHMLVCFERVEA